MSSDTSMSRQNCQPQHPTNPTKTVTGILPGDVVIALALAAAAAAASTFIGGGVGICNIVALLGESWIVMNCTNTR